MKRLNASTTSPVTVVRQGAHDGPVIGYRIGETFLAVEDGWEFTLEDIPDPLPTEPGAVFWGYGAKVRNAHEACRWMVVLDVDADGQPDPARITYISQRYQEWSPAEAERYGLCVLPGPEATS